ncbi:MAG: hypothetical protein M3380_15240 [Chloroflexota bacterium]|nr:hypothetical protein [Chloroflexota bacterium]
MTQDAFGDQPNYDRSEMFAIGAAAGALIATAIQETLERRRRPKTPLEQATARAAELKESAAGYVPGLFRRRRKTRLELATERAAELRESAAERAAELRGSATGYISDLSTQGRKAARKQAKQSRKQAGKLSNIATGALSAAAVSNVVGQARRRREDAWLEGDEDRGAKPSRRWFGRTGETAQEYAEAAREAVADALPGRRRSRGWWRAASDTAQESAEVARSAVADGKATDRLSGAAASAGGLLGTVGGSLWGYVESARETVADAELGPKARSAAAIARERLEEAQLGEKARSAAATAGETLREAAGTARERLAEAELGPRTREYAGVAAEAVKDYGVKAGKAASSVAESTAEGARDVRKGVRKRVKRTRRRVNWGLRAFITGLIVGLLTAPQSGRRTRDTLQNFVQDMLDLVLPDDQTGRSPTS